MATARKSAATPKKTAAQSKSKQSAKSDAPKTSPDATERPIDPAAPNPEPENREGKVDRKRDEDSTGSATTKAPDVPASQPNVPKQVVFQGEDPPQIDV